jgi:hypothetical protein
VRIDVDLGVWTDLLGGAFHGSILKAERGEPRERVLAPSAGVRAIAHVTLELMLHGREDLFDVRISRLGFVVTAVHGWKCGIRKL